MTHHSNDMRAGLALATHHCAGTGESVDPTRPPMRARASLAAALLGVFLLAGGAGAQEVDHGAMGHGAHAQGAETSPSQRMMQAMDAMNASMAETPMTGRPGLDFAEMMIPHHQSAIDMAKAYLDSGENDPTITRISRDVISSQEKEIAELKAWIEANRDR